MVAYSAYSSNIMANQLYLLCDWCKEYFKYDGGKTNKFCSSSHKQAAYRARHKKAAA